MHHCQSVHNQERQDFTQQKQSDDSAISTQDRYNNKHMHTQPTELALFSLYTLSIQLLAVILLHEKNATWGKIQILQLQIWVFISVSCVISSRVNAFTKFHSKIPWILKSSTIRSLIRSIYLLKTKLETQITKNVSVKEFILPRTFCQRNSLTAGFSRSILWFEGKLNNVFDQPCVIKLACRELIHIVIYYFLWVNKCINIFSYENSNSINLILKCIRHINTIYKKLLSRYTEQAKLFFQG